MKTKNRIMRSLMSLVIAFAVIALIGGVNTQAAVKRKCTYKYDSKKGVVFEPTVRVVTKYHEDFWSYGTKEDVKDWYGSGSGMKNPLYFGNDYTSRMWVAADGAKVSVKSNSDKLLCKVAYQYNYKGERYTQPYSYVGWTDDNTGKYVYPIPALKDKNFKSVFGIEMFAKESGTYSVTVTVKKGKKKLVTKKIKVIALDSFATVKYGGNEYEGYLSRYGSYFNSISTDKKSGKLKIKANKTFKITKVEVGKDISTTYDGNKGKEYPETVKYKKIKNGGKITLNTNKKYTRTDKYAYSNSSNVYTYKYDYMFPATRVRVTYVDTLHGIENVETFTIGYIK